MDRGRTEFHGERVPELEAERGRVIGLAMGSMLRAYGLLATVSPGIPVISIPRSQELNRQTLA